MNTMRLMKKEHPELEKKVVVGGCWFPTKMVRDALSTFARRFSANATQTERGAHIHRSCATAIARGCADGNRRRPGGLEKHQLSLSADSADQEVMKWFNSTVKPKDDSRYILHLTDIRQLSLGSTAYMFDLH
ncbi:hypothetical protein HDU90_007212 [Geranomyces variabilis]|nr:hypothetical protein HDU90_007212 [Geranomyces variabilis]